MRSRPIVAGVPIAIIVVLMALVLRHRMHPTPASQTASPNPAPPSNAPAPAAATAAPQPIHGERQLVAQILEHGLTAARAKLLFSMVVGPLPGVTVPEGSRNPADWDGTLAVSYLETVWDSLTPDQRIAASQLIHRSGPSAGGRQSSAAAYRSMVVPVAYDRAADAPTVDYQALGDTANVILSALLKSPRVKPTVEVDYGPPLATEYAHTTSWTKPEDVIIASCYVKLWGQKIAPLGYTDVKAIVTHEMVHCYQQRETGSPQASLSVHPWIGEGEATWAMQVVVPGASDAIMDSCWAAYLTHPTTSFATRSYDAVGVYAHMADLAGDAAVWPKLLAMVTMSMGGGQGDIDAFNLLTAGNQVTYFTDWGSSYFEVDQKTPWEMLNRYPSSAHGPSPQSVTVDAHTVEELPPVGPYESAVAQLQGSADIAIVALLTGYGRIHDKDFALDKALDVSAPVALCLKQGGCKCPDGSPGASLFTEPATAPVSLGMNGGNTTAQVGVAGESLDQFCKQPDPPPLSDAASGAGGGRMAGGQTSSDTLPTPPQGESRGDTHVVTLDGLNYDFQVVGEYTLVKSTKDDFVVQVRMVPVRGSNAVSMNQAIATKLDGHRVTISIENANEVLRVDGKEVLGQPPAPLNGAVLCTETMYGPSCQLNWPDGTIVRATQIESFALNVTVQPARARLGALVGLLGNGDGSPANDLVGTGQAHLGTQPSTQDINHSLASAWRVQPAASLFDYLPGQSSRAFADTTFPRGGADATRLANRDSAEKTCRGEGITDTHLLDDCILDLAVTHNFVYASVYSHAQQTMDARAALRPNATPGVLRALAKDGTITNKSQQPLFTFAVRDSDVMWIDSAGCQDANGTIRMNLLWHAPADSSAWDGRLDELPGTGHHELVPICQAGRIPWLGGLMAGTVAVLVNPNKDETGTFHIPVRFVRLDHYRRIAYGTVVDGVIENSGVHDVYTFIGHPGDLIRLSGDGCDLGRIAVGILELGVMSEQLGGCTGNDYTLPPNAAHVGNDSTYWLIVNWGNGDKAEAPTKYHFVFRGAAGK